MFNHRGHRGHREREGIKKTEKIKPQSSQRAQRNKILKRIGKTRRVFNTLFKLSRNL